MRRSFSVLMLLALVLSLSIGGTFAIWTFADTACDSMTSYSHFKFMAWTGAEILPDDDSEGDNHRKLIEAILNGTVTNSNGTVTGLGLNYKGSYINNEIEDRSSGWFASSDTLGSMDFWEASNINKYFNTSTENISFVLHFPDGVSDTYYLYTTSEELGSGNAPVTPIGQSILPIYRTILRKNNQGVWEATETKVGSAKSAWYDNRITGSLLRYPSFDPDSWVETPQE